MSDLTSHLELEQYLNDKDKLIILHTLDGEIWGASISAMDLLGYSNEEIQQIYLADIKPKCLRLSDVCKTQQSKDAPVVFERRNGRRFVAAVNMKIIRTTLLNKTVDLVNLELEVINSNPTDLNIPEELDLQEATGYIRGLSEEIKEPLQHIQGFLEALRNSGLNQEQEQLVKSIDSLYSDTKFLNQNIADSIKLGINALKLERQPFNIADLVGNYAEQWGKVSNVISIYLDSAVPELVYGDEKRLIQIIENFTRKSLSLYNPKQIFLSVNPNANELETDCLRFDIKITKDISCNESSSDNPMETEGTDTVFEEEPTIYVSKNLLRLMGGSLKISENESTLIDISFLVTLPEVHDLGLKGNRKFLKHNSILLIEGSESLLSDQLRTWGAHIEKFSLINDALEYLSSNSDKNKFTVIIHIEDDDEGKYDHGLIKQIDAIENTDILLIKPKHKVIEGGSDIISIPTPYQPALLGNILSQYVHAQFPFPYINVHQKRSDTYSVNGGRRILLVNDVEVVRAPIQEMLEKNNFAVDIAVNGIDSVLACAHYRYELILMAINLPYMDGLEAVIHLRKISELNLDTPVILLGGDSSENTKRSMQQVGIETMAISPEDLGKLDDKIKETLSDPDNNSEPSTVESTAVERRVVHAESYQLDTPVDEDVIHRLIDDTSKTICREMVDMFIEESLMTIGELQKSYQNGDWASAANHAHIISASSGTFGCEALSKIATQLETESEKSNRGECIHLASQLPQVFLKSQQNLYEIFSRFDAE